MWPFNKTEHRAEGDYTEQAINVAEVEALGGTLDAGTLGVAEACMGLWERSLASATVEPMGGRLAALDPPFLALVARSLALHGNFTALIELDGLTVRLLPSATFDVHGDARSQWYRLDVVGPDTTQTARAGAEAVFHVSINAESRQWWRGVSPLKRSKSTASLAAKIEGSLSREADIYVTRFAGVDRRGTFENWKKTVETIRRRKGGITFTGGILGQGESGRVPDPAKMGPAPDDTFADALRSAVGRDICAAFGVPVSLFAERGDGAGQREAWRRFWLGTVQPLALLVQAECKAKLDPSCIVTLDALRAADEDGRSRAVSRRASAFKTLRDAGIDTAEARRLAGLEG